MRQFIYGAAIFAAFAMVFSCNTEKGGDNVTPGGSDEPVIAFTQVGNVNVPFNGGNVSVDYTVTNPVENAGLEVDVQGVDWISNIDTSVDGTVSFTVAENEANEPRSIVLTLRYTYEGGETMAQINLIQDANSLVSDVVLSYAGGYYYGNRMGTTDCVMYYVWLTENPISDGYLGSGDNYAFAIFAAEPEDMTTLAPPAGTYTFSSSYEAGTFEAENSRYVNGDDGSEIYFTDGTLVVTKEGDVYTYTAIVTDTKGEQRRVTYTGPVSLEDNSKAPTYSTLTGDYEADLAGASCYAYYYGDYYQSGSSNYTVQIIPQNGGDALLMDVLCPLESDLETGMATGEYTITNTAKENTLIAGYISGDGYLMGTWYAEVNSNGQVVGQMAPLMSGSLKITDNGNGTLTMVLEAKDDLDPANTVTASWTGTVTYVDGREAPAKVAAFKNAGNFISAGLL